MSNFGKRNFDLLAAGLLLVVTAPVLLAIACAVRFTMGSPVLFRQVRIGRARRPFVILKFRSMRDGRVTRVGRLLRPTGLDELPQFVNILRGELSAVGPRPLTESDIVRLHWKSPSGAFTMLVIFCSTQQSSDAFTRPGKVRCSRAASWVSRRAPSAASSVGASGVPIGPLEKSQTGSERSSA